MTIRENAADIIIVGAGLAGLVAAYEATQQGLRVLIVDQENEANLGGQAFWSLGGLFLVDSPEQRRIGVKDSLELAWNDWMNSAQFDREEDYWPRQWARAYVEFAAGPKRDYLHKLGLRIIPTVGWAERGGFDAASHGNSVPRFHISWGTGPEVVRIFADQVDKARQQGLVTFAFRHQVDEILHEDNAVIGVRGSVLQPCDDLPRGEESSREIVGEFKFFAPAVLVSSGGIGGNAQAVIDNWPVERLGAAPKSMVCGVPAHVDGRMIEISEQAGADTINRDRMWHYTEGVHNFDPIWPNHGIRIIPGPSSMWFDSNGDRLQAPCYPGFDTMSTLKRILSTGEDYSWFILDEAIIEKEFALSGSEQNPDFTGKDFKMLSQRLKKGAPAPVAAFMDQGVDFVVADDFHQLVVGMNKLVPDNPVDEDYLRRQVELRDCQVDNPFSKDGQTMAIANARKVLTEKVVRVAAPHKLLDGSGGKLIAVKLHILTRKTLGGLHTNLDSQCLDRHGNPITGLYAAGEVAGFGGGGVHGYNALEGTFLGGCIFSGYQAGRAMATTIALKHDN